MRRLLLLLLLSLVPADAVVGQASVRVVVTDTSATLSTGAAVRVLAFGRPGPIVPVSMRLDGGRERLSGAGAPAWFELDVDGRRLTSLDPVWTLADHRLADLGHGGREAALTFRVAQGAATGLRVRYVVQAFPGAAVFRERLELSADPGVPLALTRPGGRLHLVFPRYAFRPEAADTLRTREIRLAGWARELVPRPPDAPAPDERDAPKGWRPAANLAQNYMYHPRRIDTTGAGAADHRGPVVLQHAGGAGWMLAYEHGAPDDEPPFIVVGREAPAVLAVRPVRGAYFDGEPIGADRPFRTVWADVGLYEGPSFDAGEALLWDFLYRWINDEPASREPVVYYNTWGMQRDEQRKGRDVHGVLTFDRVLQEVRRADRLGVQMFVLDDGWQAHFGDWQPHPGRFPRGLAPLADTLARRGLLFGIWLAPNHVDAASEVARRHPEWLLRDAGGRTVVGRWERPVACLVSDYYDHFVAAAKRLVDAGVTHMKWDGVDTNHRCASPAHHHGDASQPAAEREDRYAYEFVRTVTRAIADLKAYRPDVVVEFDVTEPDRSVGLAVLSEAKFYWMNNGASWYGDRSHLRAQSMRMTPALYHGLIPPVLMNYANYPHEDPTFHAQRYAVNTSLLGGLGLWGDLTALSDDEIDRAAALVGAARRVAPAAFGVRPEVRGAVGATPEVYTYVDRARAQGQVIAFSGAAAVYEHTVPGVPADRLLAVLRNAYRTDSAGLHLSFVFPMPDVSREAFVVGNDGAGVGVVASTSWLQDARLDADGRLRFTVGAPGTHLVRWPRSRGVPRVRAEGSVTSDEQPSSDASALLLRVRTTTPGAVVTVEARP